MTRHVIQGYFGTADRANLSAVGHDEKSTRFNLVARGTILDHGIGNALADLKSIGVFPTEIGLDLLVIAAHVHASDTRISRDTESDDSWTREIRLVVPVSDVPRWSTAVEIIERMLNFLTGDRWTLQFRSRPPGFMVHVPQRTLNTPPFTGISLFSGGLDSLIGAIDQLHGDQTPLLVSHAGEPAVSKAQDECFEQIKNCFPNRQFERFRAWITFPKDFVRGVPSEDTTRGRSFLFFALGIFAGSGLSRDFVLTAPENGFIALNVPLDVLRLGALSTRTTHPFYIARWNDLLDIIEIPGRIENPYWSMTKGEMVAACSNRAFLKSIAPFSLSCSSPTKGRWQGHATKHCGYCFPCLIRRASLVSLGDPTTYGVPNLRAEKWDPNTAKGEQIRSLQLAIERLHSRPGIEKLLVHKPGPLTDHPQAVAQLSGVYKRGLEEIAVLLQGVQTRPS